MTYQVSLPNFEGPLDLLYHLVKKAEVDIYEISISEITDQYIAYLEQWEKFDLEIASEFLVMAARLMELKSRELLPKPVVVSEDETDDPKQELITKIMEYKFFKEIAYQLHDKERERNQVYWREKPLAPEKKEEVNLGDLNMIDLMKAFQKVLKKHENNNRVEKIETDEISISEQKEKVIYKLSNQTHKALMFEELFESLNSRLEIITTFLALLDLVKERSILVSQQSIRSPLWIQLKR